MAMCPLVSYIPCDKSSKEQTGETITFTYLEEENVSYNTCEDVEINDESGDKSKDDPIMPLLLSLE